MEYTVQKLAKLAGLSARTLRYYDQIELLVPRRVNSSGYRIYGPAEVERLQQILFYRELGVSLDQIKAILDDPAFNALVALRSHREQLLAKRRQLDLLIVNVNKTISQTEGGSEMSDQEKFVGFKQQLIEKNEQQYGREARAKFGDETVDRSNQRLLGMSEQEYAGLQKLGEQVMETLHAAFAAGDPASELAQKAADLHRQWLGYTWPGYSPEAHANLAQMYVDDPRFAAFYEQGQPGVAAFLRDAIFIYTGTKK